MRSIYLDEIKKTSVKISCLHILSTGFTKIFPRLSSKFFLKLLCSPRSRREYELRTKKNPKIHKVKTKMGEVCLYRFGNGPKNIFLTHGWADSTRRFTSLIDKLLLNDNLSVWSLDHIGHGKSDGNLAHLFGFIDGLDKSIKFINSKGFKVDTFISHSMGGLALLNLEEEKLKSSNKIIISSPSKFFEFMFKRISSIGVSPYTLNNLLTKISFQYGTDWNSLSPDQNTHKINSSFLFIHDEDDEVCSIKNLKNLIKNKEHRFFSTKGLGHLKILKDESVLDRIFKEV